MFSSVMNDLAAIAVAESGMPVSLNERAIDVVEAYCSLMSEENIARYINKVKESGMIGPFLMLLCGMPGRIVGIFGGEEILGSILQGSLPFESQHSVHFLRKAICSPMIC